jgi:hypothetical protein
MRLSYVSPTIVLLLLLSSSAAEAQLCAGNPSFTNQPYQVGLTAAFTDDAHGIGGDFAAGGDEFFAGAGVSVINFRDADVTSTQVTAFGGADWAVNQSQTVFVCPVAHVGFGAGPDFGNVDVSTFRLGAGGRIGVMASSSTELMVIPTFGLTAEYTRVDFEVGNVDDSEGDSSGEASFGVGFVFNRNIGIVPEISVPFSAGNSDPVFSVRFSFAFGR